jgi:hypothetical protein
LFVKRLAGIALGLSLLMPTLHWEAHLFDSVTAALDGGPELAGGELRPPVDVSDVPGVGAVVDKVSELLHVDQLVG